MTMPVRALPVLQNWDCAGCSQCCRSYHIPVTAAERARIEGQGWQDDPELKDTPFFVREKGEYRLNHRPDGPCVFLGSDNRCRIHAKFGSAAKPLACRVYPFMLVPTGDHWRLGLRLACPAAADNAGRPLSEHLAETREYAKTMEEAAGGAIAEAPPPPLQRKQVVPWADLFRIVTMFSRWLGDTEMPLERRWRKVLFVTDMVRKATLDGKGDAKKSVTGGRLSEMLHVLGLAADEEEPKTAEEVKPPAWVGRAVFRPLLAVYARKDHGPDKGTAQSGPLGRILAASRFARGKGRIPKLHAQIPETTFTAAEQPAGPLSPDADALLTRYYRLKVESMQFCGRTNFDLPFWDGLESLALTFPAILWLSRVFAADGRGRDAAIKPALQLVDDNFGFNKLLGLGRQKHAVRMLSNRGEVAKLVAWYSR
ncbi:MAG TPA: YkgJ family cysteine cluster protein [Gemmataceae bacterium]|nr:YkgJ family cysteine cluster protein [Gemmataceae bacterium]